MGAYENFLAKEAARKAAPVQEPAGGDVAPGPAASGAPAPAPAPAGETAYDRFLAKQKAPDEGAARVMAEKLEGGKFQRSLDGDTIDISRGKRRTPTRFAGIDAPEMGQGELGKAAQVYLDQIIAANGGDLRMGMRKTDNHGRDLGIIYSGKKNLNVEMVRGGFARVYGAYQKELSPEMQKEFADAEAFAKRRKLGIWADVNSDLEAPDEWRHRQTAAGAMAAGHEVRPLVDPDTLSGSDSYKRFLKKTYGERAGGGDAPRAPRMEADGGPLIQPGDKPAQKDGILERTLGGLDYLGNISRSAIAGAKDGGAQLALQYANQAASHQRKTDATTLRDKVTGKRVRFGKDDGVFDIGDVGDFGADLATDIVTDPLTWGTAAVSSVAKGGKLAKVLPGLHEAAMDAKMGLGTAGAAKWETMKHVLGASMGATYAIGGQNYDAKDSTTDRIVQTVGAGAAGAVAGWYGPTVMGKVGTKGRELANKASDAYAEYTRGSRFAEFTTAREIAANAYDKTKRIGEWIRQGRQEALDGLEPVDRLRTAQLMEDLKSEFITRRNRIQDMQAEGAELGFKGKTNTQQLANQVDRIVTEDIEKTFLPKLMEGEKREVIDAVTKWGQHNDSVIKELNKQAFGLANGAPDKAGKGLFGIRWHIDDVSDMRDLKSAENALTSTQQVIHKAKSVDRSLASNKMAQEAFAQKFGKAFDAATASRAETDAMIELANEARDATYGAYTAKFAGKFLDQTESKAMALIREYAETPPSQGILRGTERVLKGYDKLTNFIKANMLFLSVSWVKNNYFDNLAKAYIETGAHGLVDAATFGKLRTGVSEDVKALMANRHKAYLSEETSDALKYGVLDNPMFKSLEDKGTRALLYRPAEIAAAGKKSIGDRLTEFAVDNPISSRVQTLGSHMEGTARMITYVRIKDALLSSPRFKNATPEMVDAAKQAAADIVKKTFFDYGDVTHLEKAVLQRLLPFYSFYSKNLPYWAKGLVDPERVGRIAAVQKVNNNIGQDPTDADKEGLSPYLANNQPRKLGKDAKGNKVYAIVPSSSMADAIKMADPREIGNQFVDKGSTILKGAFELATNKDLFAGGGLTPTQIKKDDIAEKGYDDGKPGKKFLFSRGFKHAAYKAAIDKLLGEGAWHDLATKALGVEGVQLDNNGNPYTTSDSDARLDKIYSTIWPKGIVDQVAGSVGKVMVGKEDVAQSLLNRSLPIQEVKVSPDYERMVRQRKAKEKAKGAKP